MKGIVIYYSYGGNTRGIAERISRELGADIAEIKTVKPYEGSYNDVVEQGHQEVQRGFEPEIEPVNVDLGGYDTVILGAPVWWYTFAPAVKTFLSGADLSDKQLYPFATNGGWIGHTFQDMKDACPGAVVHDGLNLHFNGNRLASSEKEIKRWIQGIGN